MKETQIVFLLYIGKRTQSLKVNFCIKKLFIPQNKDTLKKMVSKTNYFGL